MRERVPVSSEAEALVTRSLTQRNRLIHDFFRDHAENFLSDAGRREMIAELRNMTGLFRAADEASESVSGPLFASIGVTPEIVLSELAALRRRAEARDRAT